MIVKTVITHQLYAENRQTLNSELRTANSELQLQLELLQFFTNVGNKV